MENTICYNCKYIGKKAIPSEYPKGNTTKAIFARGHCCLHYSNITKGPITGTLCYVEGDLTLLNKGNCANYKKNALESIEDFEITLGVILGIGFIVIIIILFILD